MATQFYTPVLGGEERAVEDLSRSLVRRGHSVAVATLAHPGSPAFEIKDGVRVHRIRASAGRVGRLFREAERHHVPPTPDPEAMVALWQVVRSERPEVIHAHNWLVHSLVPLKRRLGAPLVLSLHDHSLVCSTKRLMRGPDPCAGPGIRKCLACASEHYGMAKGAPIAAALMSSAGAVRSAVDMFLPVSHAVAERSRLVEAGALYEVIPNFVPDGLFEGRDTADGQAESLPGPGFLLFVGDLTHDKGAEVLLAAYAGLRGAPSLVLIGRPYAYAERELPPGVLVLGMRPHATVLEALRRCSVAIVPSILCEAFGIAALEAMAAGRPVVAARSGGLADVVVDGQTGYLVTPGEAEPLRAVLETLLGDPELRERMGAAGQRRTQAVFSEDAVISRLEDIYGKLAARRRDGKPGRGRRARAKSRRGLLPKAVR